MHQFTTLRFLSPLHPSLSPLLFNPRRRPFSLCTVFSSLPKKQRNSPPSSSSSSSSSLSHRSKFKSSLTERKKGQKPTSMEETEPVGFNKRRAEGRDKSDLPKTLQLKVRKLNPVNTICYVQLLGTGLDTQDTSPSVLLFFDKQRFIFNAGEGLQRFCTEHKIKLSKVDHIFLTRVSSETAGGLPGLLLTLAGMGDQGMSVKLWGPSDFKYLVDAMKSFIPNAAMVHSQRFGPSLDGEGIGVPDPKKFSEPIDLVNDELVKISAILLRPSVSNDTTVSESNETPLSHFTNGKAQGALKPGDLSVIYVCELPEIKGKFDPEKAKKLGLKAGPKYRELQLGKSVKSDRLDIMVHPSDVLGPSIPGPIVVLVDCPTVSHLQDLLTVESLTKYYKDSSSDLSENKNAQMVNCVIHLSPSYVRNTPDYQRWMERFGGVQHIMAGHEPRNIEIPVLKSSARIAARLNYLCPQFFPAPGFWSLQSLNNLALSSTSLSEGVQVTSAENLLKFHLRPYANLGFDRSCIPRSTTSEEIIDDLLEEIPEIVDASHKVCQLSSQNYNTLREEPWLCDNELPSCLENVRREDMEIVLLGTGSSQPSKYRNVSSIYINLFSKGGLLFDCGEGTLGQLKRRFGVEGADNAVRSLRCIWISHIHADHHTGLARVLALRRDLVKGVPHEPLLVIGPGQLKRFLNAYQRLEELDMQFIDCRHTTQVSWDAFESALGSNTDNSSLTTHQDVDKTLFAKGTPMQSVWKRPGSLVDHQDAFLMLNKLKETLEDSGLERLICVPVVHCPQAFGVVLKAGERINDTGKFIPGWKIAYSGDTRPCPALIEASLGATVLIHEATFEDGMVDEAVARNHSTTKEAIEVGEKAGVYRIILTHFSQRYPKIPVFEESHMHNTCIGFDLMSINLADLPLLPRVLPFLKLLFRNEMVLDDSDDVSEAAVGVFR